MELFDTHCHIHEAGAELREGNYTQALWSRHGKPDPDQILSDAAADGVSRVICVGTTAEDSAVAVNFVKNRSNAWASIGIHPHEAKDHIKDKQKLEEFRNLINGDKVAAIGEAGLDYYYEHSPKKEQRELLLYQLQLANDHNLPMIFHVRDAFDDFWDILNDFKNIKGVVHSFTATTRVLDQALARGMYIGLNGIMTFTKDESQIAAAKAAPLQKLLLETDAPYLTPKPFRGTICEPKHVRVVAEFLADLRNESVEELAFVTTTNAKELFNL